MTLHHWAIAEAPSVWGHTSTEESPPDTSKWTGRADCEFQEVDRPPNMGEVPDGAGSWTLPLRVARDRRWDIAKVYREVRINGGCATPSGAVDTDAESRNLISGSVVMAQLAGAAFSTSWRLADNNYVTLDAAAMIALGMAVGRFVAACYLASFAISDALDAAAAIDAAAIAAVDIQAGYPPA